MNRKARADREGPRQLGSLSDSADAEVQRGSGYREEDARERVAAGVGAEGTLACSKL